MTLPAREAKPNVIVFFMDDMGYADPACYGAKNYATPHLDRLAAEGARFTDFYASSAVCSASRAALLTGCYHERVSVRGAFGPNAGVGLHPEETTIADMLKAAGYATGMAGKWHLGDKPQWLPMAQGFDEYLGIPYSNDMWPFHPETKSFPPLPLIEGDTIINDNVKPDDQKAFTRAFTLRAVDFIKRNKDKPFFFYLAHPMVHVPLFAGPDFEGKSGAGLFGDVMQEVDWSVGQILQTIKECGIDEDTLVIFTSDNGPWLSYGNHAGSALPLREGKGTSFEGGVRVPMMARWPGKIPPGLVCREPSMTIDLLPTIAAFTGAQLPERKIDGKDIGPLLSGVKDAKSPHDALFFYYANGQLQGMRSGPWKVTFPHTSRTMEGQAPGKDGIPGKYKNLPVELALYDLVNDIGETKNLAASKPEVLAELQKKAQVIRTELGDSITGAKGTEIRPLGKGGVGK